MRCLIRNIPNASRIRLLNNKDEYLLTNLGLLINMNTGAEYDNIFNQFTEIEQVKDKDNNIIALRLNNSLMLYDPFRDEKELVIIKRKNNLLTYDELTVNFIRNGYGVHNLKSFILRKDKGQRLKEMEKAVRTATTTIKTKNNLQILITRFEIKKDLYLYRYDVNESLF